MPFFYRRKPKPPSSTIFVPLLKLFLTTHRKEPREDSTPPAQKIALDTGSPILLSGPKSRFGLGISLHLIIIPEKQRINTDLVWHNARQEMRNALILEGLTEAEADLYALRLIDPIKVPIEIEIDYTKDDLAVLMDFQRLVTYQLLQGQHYDGTINSLSEIYGDLADTFVSLSTKKEPRNPDAAAQFQDAPFRNIDLTLHQEDIEKKTILDIEGKLYEIAKFFELFSQPRYLKLTTPQDTKYVRRLYR